MTSVWLELKVHPLDARKVSLGFAKGPASDASLCVIAGFRTTQEARIFLRRVRRDPEVQRAARAAAPLKKLLQKLETTQRLWKKEHRDLLITF